VTDQEELKALLTKWEVPFSEGTDEYFQHPATHAELYVGYGPDAAPGAYTCPKIDGYSGFFTTFEFTFEGQFIKMGAWE
jgi:hypothetical protein